MKIDKLQAVLHRTPHVLRELVVGIDSDDARWKPSESDWSILEILRHLVDEETDDFRQRVQRTFANPAEPWPPINPEATAVERNYNAGQPDVALRQVTEERQKSLKWLATNAD